MLITCALLSTSAFNWHHKLGHPSLPLFQSLIKQFDLPVIKPIHVDCESCHKAKRQKLSFPLSCTTTSALFELLHLDVWGPTPISSFKGFRYYLLVIDDFTRFSWLFPMHYKCDAKVRLLSSKLLCKLSLIPVQRILGQIMGENFVNNYLSQLFLFVGIIHQTSCPHTAEQNGVVKRKH